MQTIFFLMDQHITFIFWMLTEKKRNKHQNYSVFFRPYTRPLFSDGPDAACTWLGDTHSVQLSFSLLYIFHHVFLFFFIFWKKILLFFFCFPMCALASQVFFFFYLVQPFACQGTPPSFPPTPNLYPVLVRSRRSLFFYFILFF
jgi:hypothetical protein